MYLIGDFLAIFHLDRGDFGEKSRRNWRILKKSSWQHCGSRSVQRATFASGSRIWTWKVLEQARRDLQLRLQKTRKWQRGSDHQKPPRRIFACFSQQMALLTHLKSKALLQILSVYQMSSPITSLALRDQVPAASEDDDKPGNAKLISKDLEWTTWKIINECDEKTNRVFDRIEIFTFIPEIH